LIIRDVVSSRGKKCSNLFADRLFMFAAIRNEQTTVFQTGHFPTFQANQDLGWDAGPQSGIEWED
jgi:hypothetical protein